MLACACKKHLCFWHLLFTWTFYAAAGAIGPVILGRAFDSPGSYASLLVILAVALSFAAAMNLLLPNYSNSSAIDLP